MKLARHSQIIRLIQEQDIETQEELAEKLNQAGYKVTQATVSRDIRELKFSKVTRPDGRSRYALLENPGQELEKKIYPCAERCIRFHGYGAEPAGDQDSIRYGHGCCGRPRRYASAGSGGLYCRG